MYILLFILQWPWYPAMVVIRPQIVKPPTLPTVHTTIHSTVITLIVNVYNRKVMKPIIRQIPGDPSRHYSVDSVPTFDLVRKDETFIEHRDLKQHSEHLGQSSLGCIPTDYFRSSHDNPIIM